MGLLYDDEKREIKMRCWRCTKATNRYNYSDIRRSTFCSLTGQTSKKTRYEKKRREEGERERERERERSNVWKAK